MAVTDISHAPRDMDAGSPHAATIVLASLLVSALLAGFAFVAGGEEGIAWPLASEMVSRFALLMFVAAMVAEPIGRLIPSRATAGLARERYGFVLGFAAASIASLLCLGAPIQLDGEAMSAPTVAYGLLTAMIISVLLFSTHPATKRLLGGPAWRAMQRVAIAYFWMVFALSGIGHLVGPHRPDAWYGFSVLLLVAALFVRFADAFLAHRRGMAEKVA